MTLIVLTYHDPLGGIDFMVQLLGENQVYHVTNFEDTVASVCRGSDEHEEYSCGNPNVWKTFISYLNQRFNYDFKIMDISHKS